MASRDGAHAPAATTTARRELAGLQREPHGAALLRERAYRHALPNLDPAVPAASSSAARARSAYVTPPSAWNTAVSPARAGTSAAHLVGGEGLVRHAARGERPPGPGGDRPQVEAADALDQRLATLTLQLPPGDVGRLRHPDEPLVGVVEPGDVPWLEPRA